MSGVLGKIHLPVAETWYRGVGSLPLSCCLLASMLVLSDLFVPLVPDAVMVLRFWIRGLGLGPQT